MNFRHATLADSGSILDYLKRKLTGGFLEWSRQDALDSIEWYIRSQLCGVVAEGETITAVVIGRPVHSVEQAMDDRYAVDWKGSILWVQCVASEEGASRIWEESKQVLFGYGCHLTEVAYLHYHRGKKLVIEPFAAFEKKLRALSPARANG